MIKNGSKFKSQKNLTSGLANKIVRGPSIRRTRDTRNVLHTPVVLDILKEFVLEEECRVIAAWDVKATGSITTQAIHHHKTEVYGELEENSHMFR